MGKRARKRERVGKGGRGGAANDKITKRIIGRFSTIREGIRSDLFWNKKKKGKNASDVLVSAVKFTSIGSEVAQRDVYRTNRQFNSSSYFHTGGSSRLNFVS